MEMEEQAEMDKNPQMKTNASQTHLNQIEFLEGVTEAFCFLFFLINRTYLFIYTEQLSFSYFGFFPIHLFLLILIYSSRNLARN